MDPLVLQEFQASLNTSIWYAKYQIFDIWHTKHEKTSHVSNFKTFSMDEQYRPKFGTVLITNINFLLYFLSSLTYCSQFVKILLFWIGMSFK